MFWTRWPAAVQLYLLLSGSLSFPCGWHIPALRVNTTCSNSKEDSDKVEGHILRDVWTILHIGSMYVPTGEKNHDFVVICLKPITVMKILVQNSSSPLPLKFSMFLSLKLTGLLVSSHRICQSDIKLLLSISYYFTFSQGLLLATISNFFIFHTYLQTEPIELCIMEVYSLARDCV